MPPTARRTATRAAIPKAAESLIEVTTYRSAQTIADAIGEIVGNASQAYVTMAEVSMKEIFRQVTNQAQLDVEDRVSVMFHSLEQSLYNRRHRMITINRIAGEKAQAAAVAAVPKAPRTSIPRRGRYANGFLRRAIKNPANLQVTYDGVGLFRPVVLDNAAAHWRRLNFGAAGDKGDATPRPGSYNVRFANQVIGRLSLNGYGPSPDFYIPAGAFINGQFFLDKEFKDDYVSTNRSRFGVRLERRERDRRSRARDQARESAFNNKQVRVRRQLTKGITGKNFLDEAAKQLAKSAGDGWSILFREWLEEAKRGGTSPTSHVVTPDEAKALLRQIGSRSAARNQQTLSEFRSEWARL